MKVENMLSSKGNKIANQFIITDNEGNKTFQSYDSIIVERIFWKDRIDIKLDKKYYNYSKTTSKYRNQFLNEDTKTIEAKIKSGQYILTNLNGGN